MKALRRISYTVVRLRPSFALVTQRIVCCPAKADIQVRFPASAMDGLKFFISRGRILDEKQRRLFNNFAASMSRASLPQRRQMPLKGPRFRHLPLDLGEKWTSKWTTLEKVHTQVHSQTGLDFRGDVSLTGCELRRRGRERLPVHHGASEDRVSLVAGSEE